MSNDGAPGTANAGGNGDMSVRELSELRELLFGGERRQIDELRRRLDTAELSPEELAEKLPQAIVQRAARDRQLADRARTDGRERDQRVRAPEPARDRHRDLPRARPIDSEGDRRDDGGAREHDKPRNRA